MLLLKLTVFLLLFVQPAPSIDLPLPLPHEKKLTAFYQEEQNPYMLIIGRTGKVIHCHQYEDKKEADRVLAALHLDDVEKIEHRRMESLTKFCAKEKHKFIPKTYTKKVFIYPGTKWCGMGDNAANEDELGKEKEADSCCRDHDHCKDSIPAFSIKHNLTNYSPFTKSHCDCDKQFHTCLAKARTKTATIISNLYFNLLNMECFEHKTCSSNETCITWQWKLAKSDSSAIQ
uniref:Phospholipase A2 n=1 Tax=Hadrurus spadix TaxID=141984 RepID=A0A1W7RA37_9SCOR